MIENFLGGVLPIFAIGAIGYVLGRLGTFDAAMASAINRFVFYVGIPSLLFRLLVRAPIEEFDLSLLAGFLISEITMYASGFFIGRYLFNTDLKEAVLLGLACALTNHIFFVLPIATTLFGEAAAAPIVAIITMDSIVLFVATLVIMDFMSSADASFTQVAGKIVRNPPVIATVSGLAIGLSDLVVPRSFDVFLEFAGSAAPPCALFAMGIVLSQRQEPGRAFLPVALTAVKLLIHPIIAWVLLVTLIDIPEAMITPTMMVAAAPCGAMAFVLALNYQVRVDVISRAILYSSVGGLVTITLAAAL
jgi:malonate transporter and related proteins